MPDSSRRIVASFALVVNAFVWGLAWWPFRRLDAAGVHGLWATTIVYAIASAALLAWRPSAWREFARVPGLWALAIASGATNAAFNWGVTVGEVVRVVLLFYLMPAWAVLLARVLLGERAGAAASARVALALAGAAIVIHPGGTDWPVPRSLGDWLGVAGGFAFALCNVLVRRHGQRSDAARALAMFVGALLVPGLLALLLASLATIAWPPAAGGWIAGVGALAIAFIVANLALQYGAARLTAAATAVIMTSEVLFATASAIWLGEETLTAQKALGGAMILASALLAARPSASADGADRAGRAAVRANRGRARR